MTTVTVPANVLHATSVSLGACDSCDAIHINFLDGIGAIVATAALPSQHFDTFLREFARKRHELARRHRAPERTQ